MNQCNFIGTLGRDAIVKEVNGKHVINFSIAVNEGYGENKSTLWVACAKWGDKTAVAEFLKKGTKVAVSGNAGIRTYQGNDGAGKAEMTLRVNDLHLLGGKGQEDGAPTQAVSQAEPGSGSQDLPF